MRIKCFGCIAVILVLLFVAISLHSTLDYEKTNYLKPKINLDSSFDEQQNFDRSQQLFSERYSKDALASKPKDRFKLTAQVRLRNSAAQI